MHIQTCLPYRLQKTEAAWDSPPLPPPPPISHTLNPSPTQPGATEDLASLMIQVIRPLATTKNGMSVVIYMNPDRIFKSHNVGQIIRGSISSYLPGVNSLNLPSVSTRKRTIQYSPGSQTPSRVISTVRALRERKCEMYVLPEWARTNTLDFSGYRIIVHASLGSAISMHWVSVQHCCHWFVSDHMCFNWLISEQYSCHWLPMRKCVPVLLIWFIYIFKYVYFRRGEVSCFGFPSLATRFAYLWSALPKYIGWQS